MAGETVEGNDCWRSYRHDAAARDRRGLWTIGQPLLAGIPQINWPCSSCLAAPGPRRIGQGAPSETRFVPVYHSSGLRICRPKPLFPCVHTSGGVGPWSLAEHSSYLMFLQPAAAGRRQFPLEVLQSSRARRQPNPGGGEASHYLDRAFSIRQKNQVAFSGGTIDAISDDYRSKSGHWLGVCAATSR